MNNRKFGSRSLVRQLGDWRAGSPRSPLYRQLAAALRLLVLDGRLMLGIRLPGERELASMLSISRTSVTAAYGLLREEGYLSSRAGSGYRTSLPEGPGTGTSGLLIQALSPGVIDFAAASFPATDLVHASYAAALAALPKHLPGHGYEPVGLLELRAVIAERYCRRGLPTGEEQILVTHGAQNGFALLLRMLTRSGDRILIDHPTYPHAIDAIRHVSCLPIPIGLPDEGWDMDAMTSAVRQSEPRLIYVIADFHNPTGRCMDEPTRAALASLVSGGSTLLVVDETMVDLWLDSPPPPSVATYGKERSILLLGSTGKSFWGGLRIGWIRGDAEFITALARARTAVDLGTPILEQLAGAYLLRNGAEALKARRFELGERHALMHRLLQDKLPEWRASPATGGVTLWAEMPRPIASALVTAADAAGVRIVSGSRFGVGGAFDRFIRLPYTQPPEVLTQGIERLAQVFARADRLGGSAPRELQRSTEESRHVI